MATGFESLNDLEDKVFMIFVLYKEVENLACKRQHRRGEFYFMDTIQSNELENMVPRLLTIETNGYDEIHAYYVFINLEFAPFLVVYSYIDL